VDGALAPLEQLADEVASDEPGRAGDEVGHDGLLPAGNQAVQACPCDGGHADQG
jgi:hypothetical protein